MTWRARTFALFPALWILMLLACGVRLIQAPSFSSVALLLFAAYLVPVLVYRIHNVLWPLTEGPSRIDTPEYSPWWGGHQFQVMYTAFPALEAALRLIPGCYSAWLRLWGSRIGANVYWTPLVEITDRALLEVGDNVVFGHRTACYAHFIKQRGDALVLYVRRITIGSHVMLSAGSRLGPGVQVDDGAVVPLLTDVGVGARVRKAE